MYYAIYTETTGRALNALITMFVRHAIAEGPSSIIRNMYSNTLMILLLLTLQHHQLSVKPTPLRSWKSVSPLT